MNTTEDKQLIISEWRWLAENEGVWVAVIVAWIFIIAALTVWIIVKRVKAGKSALPFRRPFKYNTIPKLERWFDNTVERKRMTLSNKYDDPLKDYAIARVLEFITKQIEEGFKLLLEKSVKIKKADELEQVFLFFTKTFFANLNSISKFIDNLSPAFVAALLDLQPILSQVMQTQIRICCNGVTTNTAERIYLFGEQVIVIIKELYFYSVKAYEDTRHIGKTILLPKHILQQAMRRHAVKIPYLRSKMDNSAYEVAKKYLHKAIEYIEKPLVAVFESTETDDITSKYYTSCQSVLAEAHVKTVDWLSKTDDKEIIAKLTVITDMTFESMIRCSGGSSVVDYEKHAYIVSIVDFGISNMIVAVTNSMKE